MSVGDYYIIHIYEARSVGWQQTVQSKSCAHTVASHSVTSRVTRDDMTAKQAGSGCPGEVRGMKFNNTTFDCYSSSTP